MNAGYVCEYALTFVAQMQQNAKRTLLSRVRDC